MASKLPIFETPFESYQANKVLGEGGAGRVYQATDSADNLVAIKCLAADRITSDRQKRFKNEIGFCQKQNHKNIVPVIDTGAIYIKEVKCPFYVMPLYSGTLRTHMTGFDPNSILPVFSQILDGIEAAHLKGVWHRDIKPENILWNEDDNQLVIADFGIAHFDEEEIYTAVETKSTSRMANFLYSAPEQRIKGGQVDSRADIFSLGLILNELFTGEIPQGNGYKHIGDVNQEFNYLDSIVESMVQQKPENRPPSIKEIKKELIRQKNSFVAMQRLEEITNKVVKNSEPEEFEHLSIDSLDYNEGILTLQFNRNIPPGWAHEFQNPRGGHASVIGYGPDYFNLQGNKATIRVRDDETFVQKIVDHAKNYTTAGNNGYMQRITDQAKQEERIEREKYEREVAEAEKKKSILSNVSL